MSTSLASNSDNLTILTLCKKIEGMIETNNMQIRMHQSFIYNGKLLINIKTISIMVSVMNLILTTFIIIPLCALNISFHI